MAVRPEPGTGATIAAPAAENPPLDLIGSTREQLSEILAAHGVPERARPMRLRQIWHWLYHRGAADITQMTTLPAELRDGLAQHCSVARPVVVDDQCSSDGTRKWLLQVAPGREVEAVHIPEADRGALCVSSQVGCSLTCSFCHTGTMALVGNLTAGQILGQIMLARDLLGEWPSPRGPRKLSHIVMMGMGEPLLNYDATVQALRIAMDRDGLAFPARRITLSTSGVVPKIEALGRDLGVGLAISLHAVHDELRNELVPINRKWNIAALIDACRAYPAADRITFEYVMLDRVNDSDADARALVRLIRGIPAKVNLIPFNPWPGAPYRCSTPERIRAFAAIVTRAGYASPVRTPRGRDILAACGQLRTASERQRRSRVAA
ncbi:MAG: 23S rRNA (adenine(2503)-C(2))-methyltransferase RlmN [Pseudomonadota bacterium]